MGLQRELNYFNEKGWDTMLPIKQRFDNDDHYEGGNDIQYIIIHDTGNETDTANGNANYFCTGDREASAHYFVDDSNIVQIVRDEDCAWHVGDGKGKYGITNRNSIGIEQCRKNNSVTPTTEANTLELVVYLMKKYNVPLERVCSHWDASRKNCPSSFNQDGKWTRWTAFKAKLAVMIKPAPTPAPQPVGDAKVKDIQHKLNILKFVGANGQPLTEDGFAGANTTFAIKEFQHRMGLDTDGQVGNITMGAMNHIINDRPMIQINTTDKIATRYIQFRLAIAVDGSFGNGTKNAVILFQKRNGLSADGVVGSNTWKALIG